MYRHRDAPVDPGSRMIGTTVNGYTGGTTFTNVLVNDLLNGVAVIPAQKSPPPLSVPPNRNLTLSGTNVLVAAGTPAGNYTLIYQICEVLNPANCDQATVTVPVIAPVILAVDDHRLGQRLYRAVRPCLPHRRLYDLVRGRVLTSTPEAPLAVPPGAVVVPGSRTLGGEFAAANGLCVSVALLVKDRDPRTDARVALEDALR